VLLLRVVLLLHVMCVTCLLCTCCTTATGLKPICSQIINIMSIKISQSVSLLGYGLDNWYERENVIFAKGSRLALRPTELPVQ
jgi:hypothetical protein